MESQTQMSEAERRAAVDRLHTSRDRLLAVLAGISEEQARFTPSPDRWSILQLAEHLAASDDHLLARIRQALATPPAPELMETVRQLDRRFTGEFKPLPRGVNKAPPALEPKSRYATLAEAASVFQESRARTIAYARETSDELRSHFAPHSILGPMDGYQWLMACALHVESHARQIEELKAHPNYPQR